MDERIERWRLILGKQADPQVRISKTAKARK